jgi:uncharacterized membrane-anchored protein
MPARKTVAAAAAGGFCIAVLSAMLVGHAWPLWTGETIYLQVVPVDPRDLFRGDYVTLRYSLNSLHRKGSRGASEGTLGSAAVTFAEGDWTREARGSYLVYVTLEPRPGGPGVPVQHVPVSVSDRKPESGVFLRGYARLYPWMRTAAGPRMRDGQLDAVNVDYGIDAFFLEEGRGRAIEHAIRSGKPVFAEVAVASSGRARLKALIADGTRIEQ